MRHDFHTIAHINPFRGAKVRTFPENYYFKRSNLYQEFRFYIYLTVVMQKFGSYLAKKK